MNTDTRVQYVTIPPDGGWGWCVVAAALLANIVTDGTTFTFGLFLDEFSKDFKAPASLVSIASSLQVGCLFIAGPLICAMINRIGFRLVAITGGLLGFIGLMGCAYAPHVYVFIACFGVLLGIACGMIYLSTVLLVGFYFERLRSVATCIAVVGTALGVTLFPPIFNVLLKDYHWRWRYKVISGGFLLVAILGFVLKPVAPIEIIIDGDDLAFTDEEKKSKNTEYPTIPDVTSNQPYVITPSRSDSRVSFKSILTSKSWRRSFSVLGSIPEAALSGSKRKRCLKCRYCCFCLWHGDRPMYRDDALFQGSYKSLTKASGMTLGSMEYHMAVTRASSLSDIPENADCCMCCPESVKRVLTTMLDLSLFKSAAFVLLGLSGLLTYLGLYTPFLYGASVLESFGTGKDKSSYVVSVIGIANIFGRAASGAFTLIPNTNAILITEITVFIAGASLFIVPLSEKYWVHILCAGIFGFNIATVSSLRTIVCVDMLGLEKLTNAFGLVLFLEGIGSLVAVPINVLLYEKTQSFLTPFFYSGFAICLSALILIPVQRISKYEKIKGLRKKLKEKKVMFNTNAKDDASSSAKT